MCYTQCILLKNNFKLRTFELNNKTEHWAKNYKTIWSKPLKPPEKHNFYHADSFKTSKTTTKKKKKKSLT